VHAPEEEHLRLQQSVGAKQLFDGDDDLHVTHLPGANALSHLPLQQSESVLQPESPVLMHVLRQVLVALLQIPPQQDEAVKHVAPSG
jgi:hypothetical protein